jgi:Arc-like DNA binding dprotein
MEETMARRAARKPDDPVKLILRFTESLRAQLEKAAAANSRSMNSEIIERLEHSLRDQALELIIRIEPREGADKEEAKASLQKLAERMIAELKAEPSRKRRRV